MPDPLDPPRLMDDPDVLNPGQHLLDTILCGTASIVRKTLVNDGLGTQSEVWTVLSLNNPCNLTSSKKWMEGEKGGEIKAVSVWRCDFELGTDCKRPDRVVVGALPYQVGQTVDFSTVSGMIFEVTDSDEGISGGLFLSVQLVLFRRV